MSQHIIIHMMNKNLFKLFFALLLFIGTTASAETTVGVKGSVTFPFLSIDDTSYNLWDKRSGFTIGPSVKMQLPVKGLAVDISSLYGQYTIIDEITHDVAGGRNFTTNIKLEEIRIPLNLRYEKQLSKVWGLYLFAGPQVNFNIGAKTYVLDYCTWRSRNAVMSLNFGAGLMLQKHCQLSVSYNLACNSTGEIWLYEGKNGFVGYRGKIKTNSLALSLGYYF